MTLPVAGTVHGSSRCSGALSVVVEDDELLFLL